MPSRGSRLTKRVAAGSVALLTGLLAPPAMAEPSCTAPAGVWGPFAAPTQAAAALERMGELTIVAIGSSSTEGVGATAPDRTYPAQLDRLLEARFPDARIDVWNEGIGGETVAQNLRRFEVDVAAHRPDLVIWQVGTNDAFQGKRPREIFNGIVEGIRRIKALGADAVLMDAQYFPEAADTDALRAAREAVAEAAGAERVIFLPRFELMRHWMEAGQFTPETLLAPDRIHMTDASYRCLAQRVADLLPDPPQRSAGQDGAAAAR